MAGRTSSLKLGTKTLTLRLNFKVMGEIEDATGVNILAPDGAQQMMRPKVLPTVLHLMAGGDSASMTSDEIAEALDFDSMSKVTKAMENLLSPNAD